MKFAIEAYFYLAFMIEFSMELVVALSLNPALINR